MPNPRTRSAPLLFACLPSLAVSLFAAPARAAVTSEGTAYRLDDGKPAYREIHMRYVTAGKPARLTLYRCMDGATFARKILIEHAGALVPDFDFIDGRTGYREGARSTGKGREVYWQKSRSDKEKRTIVHVPSDGVVDAGFDALVRTNWSTLDAGNAISASFLLPSAARFLKISIQRSPGTSTTGTIHLRMKLDTWYAFAAPDSEIDYLTSDRSLLRFKGIGNIRDNLGRNQAVRIEFPGGLQPSSPSPVEIDAARRIPLTGHCGGSP